MSHQHNSNQFTDISGILHTDVDIEFSACNLLASDDYLMLTPIRQQKLLKNKQNAKQHKSNHKKCLKELYILPKNINQSPSKAKKKIDSSKKEVCQKQTQDNSQNAMKSLSIQSPKTNAFKKETNNQNKAVLNSPKLISNKNQLQQKLRPRSISSTSIKSFQKKSAIQTGDFSKKSICSSNSKLSKVSPGPKLSKIRSQTIKGGFEYIKIKNENIIRNDYFQQDIGMEPENNKQNVKNETKSKRSCSQNKRNLIISKNAKKNGLVSEKAANKAEKCKKK